MTSLSRITLRLARNPGEGAPEGDPSRGYTIVAPLDPDGRIDLSAWRMARSRCTVVRFSPDPDERADGWLSHNGSHWYFRYDEDLEGPDEPVFRLGEHRMVADEFVSVIHKDGASLVYRITDVTALPD